jgi:hypothetical protein
MPPSGDCPAGGTHAVHVILDVTWPRSTAAVEGTGKIHLWDRIAVAGGGGAMVQACGTILPETTLTALGSAAAGGSKILIEIPGAVWDAPSMPKFPASGMIASAANGAFKLEWTSLVGLTLADPKAAWPDSYTGLSASAQDADGDGKPGYTAVPRSGGGFVLPPTAIGLGGSAPAAEKVFLVSRDAISLQGTRTSCDDAAGPAQLTALDSHAVGCSLAGGADCNQRQIDFVDQNRMKYAVKSATFVAKRVADDATCAQVRQALPM